MVPCKSTAEKVSFEWSHHRISSTDLKVKTTLHVSIIDARSESVKNDTKNRSHCRFISNVNIQLATRATRGVTDMGICLC